MYSAASCSAGDVVGVQETVNGQDGCTPLSTALGDVGLVVYCDVEAADGAYTYRAEMFATADCSGDTFTSVLGSAGSCVDIVTAGSFEVTCGADENNQDQDPTSNGHEGSGTDVTSTASMLIIIFGMIFVAVCGFLVYRYCGLGVYSGGGGRDSLASKEGGAGGVMDKSNSYAEL
jgi:hypothetical protein